MKANFVQFETRVCFINLNINDEIQLFKIGVLGGRTCNMSSLSFNLCCGVICVLFITCIANANNINYLINSVTKNIIIMFKRIVKYKFFKINPLLYCIILLFDFMLHIYKIMLHFTIIAVLCMKS